MEMLSYFLLALLGSFALPISMHAQDQAGSISLDYELPDDLSDSETTRTGIKLATNGKARIVQQHQINDSGDTGEDKMGGK
ncbi:hypothetical protein SLA2020_290000 [Shorea laevis]